MLCVVTWLCYVLFLSSEPSVRVFSFSDEKYVKTYYKLLIKETAPSAGETTTTTFLKPFMLITVGYVICNEVTLWHL